MSKQPKSSTPSEEPQAIPQPQAPPTTQPDISVEDVLSLVEQLNSKKDLAIQALLAQQRKIGEQLAMLGYHSPQPSSQPARPTSPRPVGGRAIRPDAFCKICQISGHDARMHRGQTTKKRFTPAEIAALGR